jgi:hypothetical protein
MQHSDIGDVGHTEAHYDAGTSCLVEEKACVNDCLPGTTQHIKITKT